MIRQQQTVRFLGYASALLMANDPLAKTNGDLVDVSDSQQDGANEKQGGSTLQEPEYDVQVKLSDIQADPDNPLYSAKSFEDLGL